MKTSFGKTRNKETDIALWGPTGAGKDWLIHAFIKELDFYNKNDDKYHYEILNQAPGSIDEAMPVFSLNPPNVGSDRAIDMSYIFRRIPKNSNNHRDFYSQQHKIIIHNDMGANLVECLNNPDKFESTFSILINSSNILLVIAPPIAGGNGKSESTDDLSNQNNTYSKEALDGKWTRENYLVFMQLLFNCITNAKKRNIAVCMTKCDQLGFRGRDNWGMIVRRYGNAMANLLEQNSNIHNIMTFATTSAGYIQSNGKYIPNFGNGLLLNYDDWNPINAAAPFFWIFETIEAKREKNPIAYPPIREI